MLEARLRRRSEDVAPRNDRLLGFFNNPLAVGSAMQHIIVKAIGTAALSSGYVGEIEMRAGKVFGTQSKLWATGEMDSFGSRVTGRRLGVHHYHCRRRASLLFLK
jgi:hypothetical protein